MISRRHTSAWILGKVGLIGLLIMILNQHMVIAQGGITLQGQVLDSLENEPIIGGNVLVKGEGKGAATNLNGKYQIKNLQPGTYTLRVSYISYQTKEMVVVLEGDKQNVTRDILLAPSFIVGEEVKVLAQAEGQAASIRKQINSNTIVNVVSAERLSELPDQNAAESVARLPGVSVQRNAGEAQKVVIRGLSPKFNNITVNGVKLPATDVNDRSVDLSLVPPDVLSGIDVFKAATPDKDGDNVGGTINLNVRRAPEDPFVDTRVQTGYNQLQDDFGQFKINFSAGKRFFGSKLGIIASGSFQRANRSSDVLDNDYEFNLATENLDVVNVNLADNIETRDRIGAGLNFDYKLPNGRFFSNNFMGRTQRDDLRRRKRYRVGNTRTEYDLRDREINKTTISNSLGGNHRFNNFSVNWLGSSSVSINNMPFQNTARFIELGAFKNGLTDEVPFDEVPSFARNNLDETFFQFGTFETRDVNDFNLVGEVDLNFDYTLGRNFEGSLKLGGKVSSKNRTLNRDQLRTPFGVIDEIGQNNPDQFDLVSNSFVAFSNFADEDFSAPNFLMNNFGFEFGPGLDPSALNSFRKQFSDQYEVNRVTDLSDYDAGEDIYAAFVMTELNIGSNFMLLPGIRFENTQNFYEGKFGRLREELGRRGTIVDTTGGQQYSEFLPMVQARYRIGDGFDIRASAARTLNRPDFFNLVPFENRNDSEFEVTRGNPNLPHATAWNYDFFLSYYKSNVGFLSLGLFYKKIRNVDFIRITRIQEGELSGFELTEPTTADESKVYGIEADLQTSLQFLPKPLDGLILSANVAFMESQTFFPLLKIGPRSPDPPFRPTIIDTVREGNMPGQPDMTASITVGYEIGGFSARASMTMQNDVLNEVGNVSNVDGFTRNFTFWDIIIKQEFRGIDGLEVFGNANNVLNESDGGFIGNTNILEEREFFGITADVGFRYRF